MAGHQSNVGREEDNSGEHEWTCQGGLDGRLCCCLGFYVPADNCCYHGQSDVNNCIHCIHCLSFPLYIEFHGLLIPILINSMKKHRTTSSTALLGRPERPFEYANSVRLPDGSVGYDRPLENYFDASMASHLLPSHPSSKVRSHPLFRLPAP